jgi:hypothetical protein
MQFVASLAGAVFEPLLSPGDIDENLLHRTGGGLEEMRSIGEVLVAISGNLEPRLMHEGGGLKRLPRDFAGHFCGGQTTQFIIDQGEQFVGSLGVSSLRAFEDVSHIAHVLTLAQMDREPASDFTSATSIMKFS